MKDLSLHILDIVQNSIHAGSNEIEICITETDDNRLMVSIHDNGSGMDKEHTAKVTDPFYSTKNKRFGLGLALLEQKAKQCNGSLMISSEIGKGTHVTASFEKDHVDIPPLGDMVMTMKLLICSYPGKRFVYKHIRGNNEYKFDTDEVAEALGDIDIDNPGILKIITDMMKENLEERGICWKEP